ncbi:SDR family oxidoreductase [Deinococcus koreensis]|uniref:Oxidoreductase n=1 Tax=Deinococcus koreensis TaxID=2054903 RepID=A0A2K3UX86_9DEIO|nr:SDR family oxidoreductase [Deinococcus koreensis]PNY81141.1 oxidoreductase [Deinococcus koreensis]
MNMTGNTILITGGGSGIGRALAEAFHARGNRVVIAGRRQSVLDEVTAWHPGMRSALLDISDAGSMGTFAAQLTAEVPELNVVIHNAGIMQNETLPSGDLGVAEATIATNLLGPIRLTAALLPHLLTRPQATIMTVSSGLAFVPLALTPTYGASKAAIHSYTQALRYQLKDTAVQVTELIPPYVQTGLQGEWQANDPSAMPLADFIGETLRLLEASPDAAEITVERVKALRFAEAGGAGAYNAFFTRMNDAVSAARAHG